MWGVFLTYLFCGSFVTAFPEVGHWDLVEPMGVALHFPKSVYEGTETIINIYCSESVDAELSQSIFWSNCADAFADIKQDLNGSRLPISISSDVIGQDHQERTKFKCSPTSVWPVHYTARKSGNQMIGISVTCQEKACDGVRVHVIADIKSGYGYLSAIEYPLRTFYALLSSAYVLLGLLWLCFTFCHWKDLLRIQHYITIMISAGLVEQLTSFGLYESLNRTGVAVKSALIFALIVSCLKRVLARFLLMIVCVGYGITKSRLGTAYRRIMWICALYFFCCLVDGGLRLFHPRFEPSLSILLGALPLIAVDLAILWWCFSYLVSTLRETRMRRNKIKHRLYRIFSGLLIAVALVSVLFMCVSIVLLHWKPCITAWRYIWFDETLWQLLFFVVLFAIVILWRPSSTNKLYARSAFLDPDVEPPPEDLEELLLDAIVSGINDDSTTSGKEPKNYASEDDALRWAEENIPSSQPNKNESGNPSARGSGSGLHQQQQQLKLD